MRYPTLSCLLLLLTPILGCSAPSTIFQPIAVDFSRTWDHINHPFTGAAAIDVDGEGKDELFVGGAAGQSDVLLHLDNGKLVDGQIGTGLSPQPKPSTYGVTAADLNNDGRTDLLIARGDGVTLYLNEGERRFSAHKITYRMPKDAVPFHVSVADIDRDGLLDLYISHFVDFTHFRSATFNVPEHAKRNVMLHNLGDGHFEDISEVSGTAGASNTFDAGFTDLDQDGFADLVVANNTGPVEIYRNMGDLHFERYAQFAPFGFWMGVGVGDIDGDGDQDLFFPNVGNSIPKFLTKGDLKKDQVHTHQFLLLRNDGQFKFTDVTQDYGLDNLGFGWGGVFEDLTLDGKLELLVAQNYIKWPIHNWFKLNTADLVLRHVNGRQRYQHDRNLGLETQAYSQSNVILDLNQDGRPDVVWLNMQGPLQAFINNSQNHFLAFRLPADARHLGTRISLTTKKGKSYSKEFVANQGFLTGQMPQLTFGLDAQNEVIRADIVYPDGSKQTLLHPSLNQVIPLLDKGNQ